jgi:hypothetical protein
MKKGAPKHDSSIEELEAWINDSSKICSKKSKNALNKSLEETKKQKLQKMDEEKKIKKETKKLINNKYGKQNDPLYGKKGAERKIIIEEYKKQYEQAKALKNGNSDQNITPEMLEGFMNTIREKGYNPEEIMEKLDSNNYSDEYKNELVEKIMT